MLLLLTQWLSESFSFFIVFKYYTLRAVIAAVSALLIGLLFGPMVIRKLTALKVGQAVRAYGPQTHLQKNGTPTMGGVLILLSIVITTLLWGDLTNRFVWIILLVVIGFGAVGWVDDYRKVVYKNPEGMRSREKFFWLGLVGFIASFALFFAVAAKSEADMWHLMQTWWQQGWSLEAPRQTFLLIPFFKQLVLPLGVLGFILFSWCVIVGSSNAVNFTDGLDGLAIMPTVLVGGALGIFAYMVGSENYANYLLFPHISGATEVMVVCAAIAGAGLAFLWFNAHPAEVFMGDVGALALGGALGTIAVIVRQEIILFVMGGIFVAETISVMLQVSWFKYTKKRYGEGRRIFRMAPLHHHFEMGGMKETKVVIRFWIVTVVLVLIGIASLKLR